MTSALAIIPDAPDGLALVESEARVADWLASLDDMPTLEEAARRLDALHTYYDRSSDDAAAARRLAILARHRMGTLLPPEKPGPEPGFVTDGNEPMPAAERVAHHRLRALAKVPEPEARRIVNELPRPSAAAVIRAATPAPEVAPIAMLNEPAPEPHVAPAQDGRPTSSEAQGVIRRLREVIDDLARIESMSPEQHKALARLVRRLTPMVEAHDVRVYDLRA